MSISVQTLAERINADLLNASDDVMITGAASLEDAGSADISFLSNPKYAQQALQSKAGVVILGKDMPELQCPKLISANPYLAWAKVLQFFIPDRTLCLPNGVHESAIVHESVQLGSNVHIGANAVIGANTQIADNCIIHAGVVIEENCRVAADTQIHPNAVVHYGTQIGSRCVIWSNAVIGAYGFGNARDGASYVGIPQLGDVIIEDDVSIGACATVDRAALSSTIIKRGAKIDNMVMIAHNVEIGEDTAIASQTGISGSTKVGDRVIIAGQAGFVGHIHIGHDSFIGAKAGISRSFPPGSKISGYPARDLMAVRRSDAALVKLPELQKKVKQLEKQIQALLASANLSDAD